MQANLVEGFDLKSFGPGSAKALHAEIEAIKVAKSDIYRYVADPNFTSVPTAGVRNLGWMEAKTFGNTWSRAIE